MGGETLQDLCELIVDCPHKTAPRSEDHFAYAVGTTAIGADGTIRFDKARPVDAATFQTWTARAVPQPGDLIFCREAPVGPVAVVPAAPRVCLGQRTMLLRPDRRRLDPAWLAYMLRSPLTLTALLSMTEGSTVAHLNVSDVRRYRIAAPAITEQRAIASVLAALDDKIESNRRLVAAQRCVRAARYLHLVRDVQGRRAVGDFASIVKATIQPSQAPDRLFEQFSIPAFDASEDPELCLGIAMASGKTPLPAVPTVLVSKLNPSTWRVWGPAPSGMGAPVCSPEFVVLQSTDVPHAWLEQSVRSDAGLRADVMAAVAGTTGSRQRIKPSDVLVATVPDVPAEVISEWDAFATPLLAREAGLDRERRTLTALRDALLPKLVSGQIRVPQAREEEAAVQAVAPQRGHRSSEPAP